MPGKARRAVKLPQQNEALDEKEKRVAKQLLESAVTDPNARRLAQEALERLDGSKSGEPEEETVALHDTDESIRAALRLYADSDPDARRLLEGYEAEDAFRRSAESKIDFSQGVTAETDKNHGIEQDRPVDRKRIQIAQREARLSAEGEKRRSLERMDDVFLQEVVADADMNPQARQFAQQWLQEVGGVAKAREKMVTPTSSPRPTMKEAWNHLQSVASTVNSPDEWIRLLELNESAGVALDMFCPIFGMEGRTAVRHLFSELAISIQSGEDWQGAFLHAMEFMRSLNPQGAAQCMLAVQMCAVHVHSMRTIIRAASMSDTNPQPLDGATTRAIKLMRLYASQAELLGRLQGKLTSQRIVVEKVDIREGGQAVVGSIHAVKGGG